MFCEGGGGDFLAWSLQATELATYTWPTSRKMTDVKLNLEGVVIFNHSTKVKDGKKYLTSLPDTLPHLQTQA